MLGRRSRGPSSQRPAPKRGNADLLPPPSSDPQLSPEVRDQNGQRHACGARQPPEDLASQLVKWAREELRYRPRAADSSELAVSGKNGGTSKELDVDSVRRICRNEMQKIMEFLVRKVRAERTISAQRYALAHSRTTDTDYALCDKAYVETTVKVTSANDRLALEKKTISALCEEKEAKERAMIELRKRIRDMRIRWFILGSFRMSLERRVDAFNTLCERISSRLSGPEASKLSDVEALLRNGCETRLSVEIQKLCSCLRERDSGEEGNSQRSIWVQTAVKGILDGDHITLILRTLCIIVRLAAKQMSAAARQDVNGRSKRIGSEHAAINKLLHQWRETQATRSIEVQKLLNEAKVARQEIKSLLDAQDNVTIRQTIASAARLKSTEAVNGALAEDLRRRRKKVGLMEIREKELRDTELMVSAMQEILIKKRQDLHDLMSDIALLTSAMVIRVNHMRDYVLEHFLPHRNTFRLHAQKRERLQARNDVHSWRPSSPGKRMPNERSKKGVAKENRESLLEKAGVTAELEAFRGVWINGVHLNGHFSGRENKRPMLQLYSLPRASPFMTPERILDVVGYSMILAWRNLVTAWEAESFRKQQRVRMENTRKDGYRMLCELSKATNSSIMRSPQNINDEGLVALAVSFAWAARGIEQVHIEKEAARLAPCVREGAAAAEVCAAAANFAQERDDAIQGRFFRDVRVNGRSLGEWVAEIMK